MKKINKAWAWVPSLYFAEGLPYVFVMTVSVIMYKRLGISNTDIALYTSWLYLPWVIKPFWSPFVDVLKTKRWWIVTMQILLGGAFAGVAFMLPLPDFFQYSLAFLWLMAFSSATHDIAADGFYMLGLTRHEQTWFVGIRSTFYRIAMITGQGLLVIFAGFIESHSGLENHYINIHVNPDSHFETLFAPDSINISTKEGQQRILSSKDKYEIPIMQKDKAQIDSLIKLAHNWNIEKGFISDKKKSLEEQKEESESFWQQIIVIPLENFIKKNFGKEKKIKSIPTGNIEFIYLYLSKEPENETPLNFNFESGDENIDIVGDIHFKINKNNWRDPAISVIQIDSKLKRETSAILVAKSGNIPLAWSLTVTILALLYVLFFLYHKFILPYPKQDSKTIKSNIKQVLNESFNTFILFFKKKQILSIITFLIFYRFAEAQIVKLASPFLLDMRDVGGLGLTTTEVGFIYGTIGLLFLTIGGILGGFVAARHGLKYWLWPMAIAINLPDLVYVFLSWTQTESLLWINVAVAIEQIGYGFGFTAYMLVMIYASEGQHKTAHFAITTGFMALGMMIPGMFSGWLQELLGYQNFFVWIMIATIPAFLAVKLIKIDPEFGKKETNGS